MEFLLAAARDNEGATELFEAEEESLNPCNQ
jgi:hypothetical protein